VADGRPTAIPRTFVRQPLNCASGITSLSRPRRLKDHVSKHCASPQPSGPMLSPAGVHLEVWIAAELLDANEEASEALCLALFGTAVISPLPGKGNRRRQFIT